MNPKAIGKVNRAVERRREPRHRASLIANVMSIGCDEEEVALVDVSENGLAFTTRRHLEVGIQVRVQFEGCHLFCEVRNARYREYANDPGYIVGVQILEVSTGAAIWQQLTKEYRTA